MYRVKIITTQDGLWEAIYIDGKLIEEGHILGEGNSRFFLLEKAEEFKFKRSDVKVYETNDEDEKTLQIYGDFPLLLCNLKGTYE